MQRGRNIFTLKHLGCLMKHYSHVNGAQLRNPMVLLPVTPRREILIARTVHVPKKELGDLKYKKFESVEVKKTMLVRLMKKIKFFDPDKYRRVVFGYLLYERTVDNLNFDDFFKIFEMPDTFFSWFLITELHMWMLMVRLMAIPNAGQAVRNHMIEAMWKDVDERVNQLGVIRPSVKRRNIIEISHQFNAAIIGYDEGIMSDDKVLAAALWRRFFNSESNNPLHIEKLVIYVRRQIVMLDEMDSAELLKSCYVTWINLKSI